VHTHWKVGSTMRSSGPRLPYQDDTCSAWSVEGSPQWQVPDPLSVKDPPAAGAKRQP
jgi:hypothetical protein